MKFLPLILRSLLRKKTRTVFTILSIFVAFILFGYLAAIDSAFGLGVDLVGEDRLILQHKVSLVQLLPESYLRRLEAVDGIIFVTHCTWFGGVYRDPKNYFPQLVVQPERYFKMYPEFLLPEEQLSAWLEDRTGAVVGRATAQRYGFKIGDRVPIQGTFWRLADGGSTWEFTIRGIYDGAEDGTDTTQFVFRYDYFDETRVASAKGLVGWYMLRIRDPERAPEIAAKVDAMFANSFYETKTTTEKAFLRGFANQIGNIGAILTAVLAAVFFTILLVSGNTMAQSVRERSSEFAVLKTLGFSDGLVLLLVLGESFALSVFAGLAGLATAWYLISLGDPTGGVLPIFYFPPEKLVTGLSFIILLALLSGLFPAIQAMRLRIADALRRS